VQTIEKRIESRRARAEAIYREARQRSAAWIEQSRNQKPISSARHWIRRSGSSRGHGLWPLIWSPSRV